jgi:hypothetical protein
VLLDGAEEFDGADGADASEGDEFDDGPELLLDPFEPEAARAIESVVNAGTAYAVAAIRPRRLRALRRESVVASLISFVIFQTPS